MKHFSPKIGNNLFSANLLFRSVHNNQLSPNVLWEESIILIEASHLLEATEKARCIGKTKEHAYLVANGDEVAWKFFTVERVFEIDDEILTDGTELFARFLKRTEVPTNAI